MRGTRPGRRSATRAAARASAQSRVEGKGGPAHGQHNDRGHRQSPFPPAGRGPAAGPVPAPGRACATAPLRASGFLRSPARAGGPARCERMLRARNGSSRRVLRSYGCRHADDAEPAGPAAGRCARRSPRFSPRWSAANRLTRPTTNQKWSRKCPLLPSISPAGASPCWTATRSWRSGHCPSARRPRPGRRRCGAGCTPTHTHRGIGRRVIDQLADCAREIRDTDNPGAPGELKIWVERNRPGTAAVAHQAGFDDLAVLPADAARSRRPGGRSRPRPTAC